MEPQVLEYIYIQHRHMAMAGKQAGIAVRCVGRAAYRARLKDVSATLGITYIHGETEHLLAIRLKSTM